MTPVVFLSSGFEKAQALVFVPVGDIKANASLLTILTSSGTTAVKETASWAQKLLELALKIAAKQLLAKMTQATINWINSDFHGSPLFIENPESFFKDIAKSQLKFLVDAIGYDTFRFPYGPQTALNAIASYKSQLATNAQYTLSKVINDPDFLIRYRNDFNYGGWNGFLINTQYPQNNYLGFQSLIQQNLASRLEGTLVAPGRKVQQTLQQGLGFLSPQTCPSNPKYNNGVNEFLKPSFQPTTKYVPPSEDTEAAYAQADKDYEEGIAKEKDTFYAKDGPNYCPGGLVSTTPGSVAANQVFNALDTPRLATALDGAIGNSLAAIFDALINHFLEKGLNALSETISGKPSVDNWSYQGSGFGTSGSITVSTAILNIPTAVSVSVGQPTSTNISGGNGVYCLVSIASCAKTTTTVDGVAKVEITFPEGNTGGPKLTVTGIKPSLKPSATTILVTDTQGTSATVTITVNAIGEFAIIPASLSTNINGGTGGVISGGTAPYTINTDKNRGNVVDPLIATVALSDTSFVVSGLSRGMTSATIFDANGKRLDVTINVDSNASYALTVDPKNIQLAGIGSTRSITITNGNAPYTAEGSDKVATTAMDADGKSLKVTAVGGGLTTLYITDSSEPARTAFVNVDVNAPASGQDGICTENGGNGILYPIWETRYLITTKSKAECDQTKGSWEARSTSKVGPLGVCLIADEAATYCGLKSRCADSGKWGQYLYDSSGEMCIAGDTLDPIGGGSTTPAAAGPSSSLLVVSPENIWAKNVDTVNIAIAGGTPPYSIERAPDAAIATVSGPTQKNLAWSVDVSAASTGSGTSKKWKSGTTSFEIKDSSINPKKIVTVEVHFVDRVLNESQTFSIPTTVSVEKDQSSGIYVHSQTTPTVTKSDGNLTFDTTALAKNLLKFTANAITQSPLAITLRGQANQQITTKITVTETTTVTCTSYYGTQTESRKNPCTGAGGTWVKN